MYIRSCAQKNGKFSTVYPQNVENLRKLKIRWIVWIKIYGKYVDNVNQAKQIIYLFERKHSNRRIFSRIYLTNCLNVNIIEMMFLQGDSVLMIYKKKFPRHLYVIRENNTN